MLCGSVDALWTCRYSVDVLIFCGCVDVWILLECHRLFSLKFT